jgi:hypothetical protein
MCTMYHRRITVSHKLPINGRDHEQPEEAVEEAAVVQSVGGLAVLEAAAEGAAAAYTVLFLL